LVPGKHTFGGYELEALTHTITEEDYLIEFAENSFAASVPLARLRMTQNHAVVWENKMTKAKDLPHGVRVAYDGDILYNVLLKDTHGVINVEGLPCETLHPGNPIAAAYRHSTPFKINNSEGSRHFDHITVFE
jgi:hypothetical protein